MGQASMEDRERVHMLGVGKTQASGPPLAGVAGGPTPKYCLAGSGDC
jgi:hypothetical protein